MDRKEAIKDFKVYERGIKRLEELKKDLDSLDTKGFKADERAIRKKLRNVHQIPETEHDLRVLRAKISGVDVSYGGEKVDKRQSGRIRALEEKTNVVKFIPVIKRKVGSLGRVVKSKFAEVEELKSEIEGVKRLAKKKQLTKEDEKSLDRIPIIKSRLSLLEKDLKKLSKKASGEQLTKEGVKDVEKIPTLRADIISLEKKIIGPQFRTRRKVKHEIEERFRVYSKGIHRLKELEKELNSLDTKIFKKDERIIQKKLKDVSLIPEIEDDLRELKLKIVGVDVDFQKAHVHKRQDRKISRLKKELVEIEKASKRKQLTGGEVEDVKTISVLRRRVGNVKQVLLEMEKEVQRAKRKQLTRAEVKNVKAISALKHRLTLFDKKLEKEHTRKIRKQLTRAEVKDIESIPGVKKRTTLLRKLLMGRFAEMGKLQTDVEESTKLSHRKLAKEAEELKRLDVLDSGVEKALRAAYKKQLTRAEVKDIEAIPTIRGKISYIRERLKGESGKLLKLEEDTERALRAAHRKQLSKKEVKDVGEIPALGARISYLRSLLRSKTEKFEEIDDKVGRIDERVGRALRAAHRKQLTKAEIKDVEAIPTLQGRINYLRDRFKDDPGRIDKLAEDVGRIPSMKRSTGQLKKLLMSRFAEMGELRSGVEEASKLARKKQLTKDEVEDVDRIPELQKHISALKGAFTRRSGELEKEIEAKSRFKGKKAVLKKIKEVDEKVDRDKEELYNQMLAEFADSKRLIYEEKEKMQEQLLEEFEKAREVLEAEQKERNDKLLEELNKLNKKLDATKSELNKNLLAKSIQLRSQIDKNKKSFAKSEAKEDKSIAPMEPTPPTPTPPTSTTPVSSPSTFLKSGLPQLKHGLDINIFEDKKGAMGKMIPKEAEKPKKTKEILTTAILPSHSDLLKRFSERGKETNLLGEEVAMDLPNLPKLPTISSTAPSIERPTFETEYSMALELAPKKEYEPSEIKVKEVGVKKKLEVKRYEKEIKKAVTTLVPKTLKRVPQTIFLDIEDFMAAERNLHILEEHVESVESGLKEVSSMKKKEIEELNGVVENAGKIRESLLKIDASVLGKVSE